MFSKLFGKKKAERPALEHVRDLRVGDMIEFGLSDIDDISGQTFKVSQVNSVDYGDGIQPSMTLTSGRLSLGFEVVDENGEEYLQFSKLVKSKDVLKIFDGDQFGHVFNEGANSTCTVISKPEHLVDWIGNGDYRESADAIQSSYYKGDCRFDQHQNVEYFDYYELEGDDGYSVDIEVYDGGETEVYLTRQLPMHIIEELWPHGEG